MGCTYFNKYVHTYLIAEKEYISVQCTAHKHSNKTTIKAYRSGVPNLCLTMYIFRISTDEHLPLKFLMKKYFIMTNHKYI